MNPAVRLAGAAVLVLAVVGAALYVMRPVADVGPPASSRPTASPVATTADALAAYRTARNEICRTAALAFSVNNDLTGLYDPATPADRRAIVNANAQAIADAIAAMARDLAALRPPAELADAHTADVAHAQAEAAIFAGQMQLLKDARYTDAAAQEVAAEAAANLRKPFESQYNLLNCP